MAHRTPSDESDFNNLEEQMQNMDVKSKKIVNILLFGETGVGKSTFINAFTNYLNYTQLRTAMRNELKTVIPSKFTIMDENYAEREVQIGGDENECTDVGASATQYCKSYLFPIQQGKLKIRLIDTPGIADTRGIDKDNSNFENILSFISGFKQLNAICVLLKPNVSRLTVEFEYCIKQLLTRLDKSASNNLVFVFTNTRSTFYRPGETLPALKKLFGEIRSVTIPLSKSNIFCMDNEGFRFLAAYKDGVKFERKDTEDFSDSWKNSSREFWRMIHYIAGGGPENCTALEPHMVKNIISINEARRLIIQLSQPLAEIAQLIQDNISLLNRHTLSLRSSANNISELKKKLFIPFINLVVTKLDKPTTVCTDPGCSEVYEVNNVKKWHYKQRCHDPCYLTNVPKELIGSPELMHCAAMGAGSNCKICKCSYQKHMHIYYETKTVEDKIEDRDIQKRIEDGKMGTMVANNLIEKTKRRVEEYENERDTILKTTAKFAYFLQENAITPYNDAYQGYLLYLIDREKSMGVHADRKLILEYTKMLSQYEEEKRILSNALQKSSSGNETITANDIISSIQVLHRLKHTGEKIKELIATQNATRKSEFKNETNEYVYSPRRKAVKKVRNNPTSQTSDSEYATDNDRRRSKSKNSRTRGNQHFNNQRASNAFANPNNFQNNQHPNHFQYPNPNSNHPNHNFQNFNDFENRQHFPSSNGFHHQTGVGNGTPFLNPNDHHNHNYQNHNNFENRQNFPNSNRFQRHTGVGNGTPFVNPNGHQNHNYQNRNNYQNRHNFPNSNNFQNPTGVGNDNHFPNPNYYENPNNSQNQNYPNRNNFKHSNQFQSPRNLQNRPNNCAQESFIQIKTQKPNLNATQHVKVHGPQGGVDIRISQPDAETRSQRRPRQYLHPPNANFSNNSQNSFTNTKNVANPPGNFPQNYPLQPQMLPNAFKKSNNLTTKMIKNFSKGNQTHQGGIQTDSGCESGGKQKLFWHKGMQGNFHNLGGDDDSDSSSDSSTQSYRTATSKRH